VAEILLITGLSGAGRSQAADSLEDLGWFVVDNLPTSLVEKFAELANAPGSSIERVALVVGSGPHQSDVGTTVEALRAAGHHVEILFLDCGTSELVRRYGSTRRRHPMSGEGHPSVVGAIEFEREVLAPVKEQADLVIDTSDVNIHQLKARLIEHFAGGARLAGMQVSVMSFGYKHGLPLDADMVLDCRFLPNPFWIERLRPLSGLDAAVRDEVLNAEGALEFVDRVEDLLVALLPRFLAEQKSYLTVALGCTGGMHRSVAIGEELVARLRRRGYEPRVQHRDLAR
jgi:UPF0042 nucleotide-binding protein